MTVRTRARTGPDAPIRRLALGLLPALLLSGCGAGGETSRLGGTLAQLDRIPLLTPAELVEGEQLYRQYCAQCHGEGATGTDRGPPLVHAVYRPSHHSDYSFAYAVTEGVRAHHWNFGDMPPVEGLEPEQIIQVIGHLRQLQRQAGIR